MVFSLLLAEEQENITPMTEILLGIKQQRIQTERLTFALFLRQGQRRETFEVYYSEKEGEQGARKCRRPMPPNSSEKPCGWHRRAENPSHKWLMSWGSLTRGFISGAKNWLLWFGSFSRQR